MAKAGFLAKKSGFMMVETDTSNGYGSDKGTSTLKNFEGLGGFCGLGVQPFPTTTTTSTCASSYKSPVGMAAAACLRYPFTTAQWQELERQALIFKYMMASVPVPPDLLIPTPRNLPISASPYPSLSRGWFANGADPEPGRCKRTDGKKWRCSRDAAPDQKYCERHMHRSRPRSRKHVEAQSDISNANSPSLPPPSHSASTTTTTTSRQLGSSRPYPQHSPLFVSKPDFSSLPSETLSSASPYKNSKYMDWMLKSENVPVLNQDLQQLMPGKGGSARGANLYQQSYQESQNLNLYNEFAPPGFEGLGSQNQTDECLLYMNPELELFDQRQMPRHFIDAWSNARHDSAKGVATKSSGNSSGRLSPSNLSLSMSSDNGGGDEMDQIQMGLGVMDSECDNTAGSKSQTLNWMTPVSWPGSTPGGPLGEVLQSSNTISSKPVSPSRGGGINFMTDDWGRSGHTSPRGGTAMSSPSEVLHRTLTSPSDSSGGNSPTYKAAARTEVFLQWMNQNK